MEACYYGMLLMNEWMRVYLAVNRGVMPSQDHGIAVGKVQIKMYWLVVDICV